MGAKNKEDRHTVAVDFDGVIHQYTSPWVAPHIIDDPPMPEAIDWLWDMNQKFRVVIFTTRGKTWRGRRAIKKWLRKWATYNTNNRWFSFDVCMGTHTKRFFGLEEVEVTDRKPAALMYIDDRAFRFMGAFPSLDQIQATKPRKINDVAKKRLDSPRSTL